MSLGSCLPHQHRPCANTANAAECRQLRIAFNGVTTRSSKSTLRIIAFGRWAVCSAGRKPVKITSGERFRVEFLGEMRHTRMKFRDSPRRSYYTVDGYPLRDGLRAAIGEHG